VTELQKKQKKKYSLFGQFQGVFRPPKGDFTTHSLEEQKMPEFS
jgi:hypothetical protein